MSISKPDIEADAEEISLDCLLDLLPDMQDLLDPAEVSVRQQIGRGSYGTVHLGEWQL